MIFTATFKDPDNDIRDSIKSKMIEDLINKRVEDFDEKEAEENVDYLSESYDQIFGETYESLYKKISHLVEYGEYVEIEFNTDTGTARLL